MYITFQIDKGRFKKVLKRNSELFRQVDRPQEAILDAQLFKNLSRLTKNQVEALSTNAQKFNSHDFAERLLEVFEETGVSMAENFKILGDQYQHFLARPPSLHYLYGSFEAGPKMVTEKKARQSRKLLRNEPGKKCIFVGLSCAVSREGCRILTAPSDKPHVRPTDLFFRQNTLCTHLSGSNL